MTMGTGVETSFEKQFADMIGISSLYDNDFETLMSFQISPLFILLTPSAYFLPKLHLGDLPKFSKNSQFETTNLLNQRNLFLFKNANEIAYFDKTVTSLKGQCASLSLVCV